MKGYSFIETIITIFIVSVGVMAISGMTMSVIRTNSLSSKMTIAASIAQGTIEKLKGRGYRNLRSGKFNGDDVMDGFDLSWSIKKDSPVNNIALVVVTTKWKTRGAEKKIEFSTIVGK